VYGNILLHQYQDAANGGNRDYLVGARYHFEKAIALDPDDVSALVTLYQLDGGYFSALGRTEEWLQRIEDKLRTQGVNKADFAALKSLARCLASGACGGGEEVLERLLDLMAQRRPGSIGPTMLRLDYLAEKGAAAEERIALLQQALQQRPGDIGLLFRLLDEYVGRGEMGAAYDTAADVLAHDQRRFKLTYLKQLFPDLVFLSRGDG
jgi:hypothetical protein